jgi:hypothetical protein
MARRGPITVVCASAAYWFAAFWWSRPPAPKVNEYEARRKLKSDV